MPPKRARPVADAEGNHDNDNDNENDNNNQEEVPLKKRLRSASGKGKSTTTTENPQQPPARPKSKTASTANKTTAAKKKVNNGTAKKAISSNKRSNAPSKSASASRSGNQPGPATEEDDESQATRPAPETTADNVDINDDDGDESYTYSISSVSTFSVLTNTPPLPSDHLFEQTSSNQAGGTQSAPGPANRKPRAGTAPRNQLPRSAPRGRGGRSAAPSPRPPSGPSTNPPTLRIDPTPHHPTGLNDIQGSQGAARGNGSSRAFNPPLRIPEILSDAQIQSFGNDHQLDPGIRPEEERQEVLNFGLRGWQDATVSLRECQNRSLDSGGLNADRWFRLITYELSGAIINNSEHVGWLLSWLHEHVDEIGGTSNNENHHTSSGEGYTGGSGAGPNAGPSGGEGSGGGKDSEDDEDGDDKDDRHAGKPKRGGASGNKNRQGSTKGPNSSNSENTKDRKGKGRARSKEPDDAPLGASDKSSSQLSQSQFSDVSLGDLYDEPSPRGPPAPPYLLPRSSNPPTAPPIRSGDRNRSYLERLNGDDRIVRVERLEDAPEGGGRYDFATGADALRARHSLGAYEVSAFDFLREMATRRSLAGNQHFGEDVYVIFIPADHEVYKTHEIHVDASTEELNDLSLEWPSKQNT